MPSVNINTNNTFGEWLKDYCNAHNIDVTTLAKRLGIGRRHVTHWIQGTSHPRLLNGVFLIEALSSLTKEDEAKIYMSMSRHIKKDY